MLARIAYEDPQTFGNAREVDVAGLRGDLPGGVHGVSTATRDYGMVIGGVWTDSDARLEATSPGSGESLGSVPEGTREDAQQAIAAANGAWRDWSAARPSSVRRRWSGSPT